MTVLRCAECGLPWATIQNGCLIVQSVHSGKKHQNVISLVELVRLSQEEKQPSEIGASSQLVSA